MRSADQTSTPPRPAEVQGLVLIIRSRVRAIPEGFVQTYGDIDPDSPRLVGRVLAEHCRTDEDPGREDIPWHRVVRADGSVAKGSEQLRRLRREGVPTRGKRVDLRRARLPPEAI